MTISPLDALDQSVAFRDLHGARLHGFALLVMHGDRAAAAHLTNAVLENHGSRRVAMAHPERAAAVLRAELIRRARRLRRPAIDQRERLAALGTLNVDASAGEALGSLGIPARAALVAADVERFAPEDVALILTTSAARARRAVRNARHQYIAAHPGPQAGVVGPIRSRISAIAGRTFAATEADRS